MRITFILPTANLLGGTRVIAIYAQGLARRGHSVCVVSTPRRPLRWRGRIKKLLNGQGWNSHLSPGPSYLDGLPIEHRVLDRWRGVTNEDVPDGDVVIATWWETAGPVAALSPSKGAKVYFVQDYGAHAGQPLDQVSKTWELPLHKITISRWLDELVHQYVGDERTTYVPNSVDTSHFFAEPRGKQNEPTIGFVYSTRPQKGCRLALDALTCARKTIPNLRAVTFGHGAPSPDLPLVEGTTYLPNLPDARLRDVYAGCDAWLFTSTLEGFGLPILEAMACRTPVIATPAGAAPELIEQGGGLLVPHHDASALAGAILNIVKMDELSWRRMSDLAHQTATSYTWEDATDRFEAALIHARQKSAVMTPCA